jgi:hypothetical protein
MKKRPTDKTAVGLNLSVDDNKAGAAFEKVSYNFIHDALICRD